MRGKAVGQVVSGVGSRITPAYAGKSLYQFKPIHSLWDHPRLCGEKNHQKQDLMQQIGSPPPMRGKVCYRRLEYAKKRITPAYAGKSAFG